MGTGTTSSFLMLTCSAQMEKLVKSFCQVYHPQLSFSSGGKGLLVFKSSSCIDAGFQLHPNLEAVVWSYGPCYQQRPDGGFPREFSWTNDHTQFPENRFRPGETVMNSSNGEGPFLHAITINHPDQKRPQSFWWMVERPRNLLSNFPRWTLSTEVPGGCPSRAFFKAEQYWNLLPAGEVKSVLEVGSAPGGSAFFFLEQGLETVGVDPGMMDESIMKNPRFSFFPGTLKDIPYSRLTQKRYDLWVSDANLAAEEILLKVPAVLAKIGEEFRPKWLMLTLKLNQKFSERFFDLIPAMTRPFLDLGYRPHFLQNLPAHHMEMVYVFRAQHK